MIIVNIIGALLALILPTLIVYGAFKFYSLVEKITRELGYLREAVEDLAKRSGGRDR